jgi:hypothetical protein
MMALLWQAARDAPVDQAPRVAQESNRRDAGIWTFDLAWYSEVFTGAASHTPRAMPVPAGSILIASREAIGEVIAPRNRDVEG